MDINIKTKFSNGESVWAVAKSTSDITTKPIKTVGSKYLYEFTVYDIQIYIPSKRAMYMDDIYVYYCFNDFIVRHIDDYTWFNETMIDNTDKYSWIYLFSTREAAERFFETY